MAELCPHEEVTEVARLLKMGKRLRDERYSAEYFTYTDELVNIELYT